MSDGDSTLSQAADAIEDASNHKALDVLARTGFAVMALLHVIVGAIAIAIAFGHPGDAEPTGAIARLADNPFGTIVMWACVAACLGLALWQASEATLRALSLPRKERRPNWSRRVSLLSRMAAWASASRGSRWGSPAIRERTPRISVPA